MSLPKDFDGGRRAIVIEDVPAGTGIADLVSAFSPFGAIQFAYMGPPAVVGFENECSAVHALLVSSMKTASLLGFKEKKAASAAASPSEPAAAPKTRTTQIETVTAAVAPTEAAAPEAETSQDKAATAPPAVIVDREMINSIRDSITALEDNTFVDRETIGIMGNAMVALERHVGTMKELLVERCNDEYDVEDDVNDDLDHDKAWSDGYNLGFWGNSNHYDAWLAGYQAGDKDSRWKEGDTPIHGNPMLNN